MTTPEPMKFTLTVRFPGGSGQQDWQDLEGMRAELAALANVLDALVPGEIVTIERVS